ncbi:DAK2 domain-containing protein [Streptomyces sp. Z26]|uniref:DAK2 domain-containing protein n=1 Tax=Streptomyces sp. Z26 TaxID=2500177 RepID=UPI000EF1405F|nr:DAK2 domain-containing protein [Streptomyces sp. Z26]RLL69059.1 DAK2 domain-containing protein [Streptomyces sp. Z26]
MIPTRPRRTHVPQPLDPAAVRSWCALALDALARGRAEIDTINVFPVADGDTGTNMHRTVEAAATALERLPAAPRTDRAGTDAAGGDRTAAGDRTATAEALRAMARGALVGACGNSGTILAQLLRGMAEAYGAEDDPGTATAPARDGAATADAELLRRALRRAAESAYAAVARPVAGTMLTVATAAAESAARADGDTAAVARAAYAGAGEALAATTGQLDVLARAGVVDAGGRGLVAVLGALYAALAGEGRPPAPTRADAPAPAPAAGAPTGGEREPRAPEFEVMYLLDAEDDAVRVLRTRLDALGDSLVVVGGDGLWNVHVHTGDAGAAVEAGIEAGRPHRVRVTHLAAAHGRPGPAPVPAPCAAPTRTAPAHPAPDAAPDAPAAPPPRAVVAVVGGDGLAGLCAEAGATVVRSGGGPGGVDAAALADAVLRTRPTEAVLLPNDPDLQHTAADAAERLRAAGVRTAVIPTRAAVQGLAALAMHEPDRRFDEDVVAMTSAAGATRYGEVTVAERRSWTTAGVCQAGDVLGLVEGDVAVIGDDVSRTAADVLERMLAAGGELVTLVLGADAPDGLAEGLRERVRSGHLAVDTVVYEGHQRPGRLLIGVE